MLGFSRVSCMECGAFMVALVLSLSSPAMAQGPASPDAAPTPPVAEAEAEKWEPRDVLGVQFESPFPMATITDQTSALPKESRSKIELSFMANNAVRTADIQLQVNAIIYRPQMKMNLDGATQGTMKAFASAAGSADAKFKVETTKLSGLEARKTFLEVKFQDKDVRCDLLVFRRGQTMWLVQSIALTPAGFAMAKRLIESVKVPG